MHEIIPIVGGGGSNRGNGDSDRMGGGNNRGGRGGNTVEDRDSTGNNRVHMDRGQHKKGEENVVGAYDKRKKKTGDCYVTFCYKLERTMNG